MGIYFSILNSNDNDESAYMLKPKIDVEMYSGQWFELARIDNWFERGQHDATAVYEVIDENTLSVVNTAVLANGALTSIKGTGTIVPNTNNYRLNVQFKLCGVCYTCSPTSGNYCILEVGCVNELRQYSYSIVANPERTQLWVLYRHDCMHPYKLKQLLESVKLNYRFNVELKDIVYRNNALRKLMKKVCKF